MTKIIPLRLTHRAHKRQMSQHVTPGVLVLVTSAQSLFSGHSEHRWLDQLGIAAGALLIAMLLREIRSTKHVHTSKVSWFEIVAGIVLMLEGYEKLHPGKRFQPGTLTMIVGLGIIAMGIFSQSVTRVRRLELTDQGFSLRKSIFHKLKMSWEDFSLARRDKNTLVIETTAGQSRIMSLRRFENRDEIMDALNSGAPQNQIASQSA